MTDLDWMQLAKRVGPKCLPDAVLLVARFEVAGTVRRFNARIYGIASLAAF